MTKCPICKSKISFESVQHDKEHGFRMAGEPHPGQQITACFRCGQLMHTQCVRDLGVTLEGWRVRRAKLCDWVDGDARLPFCGKETIQEIVEDLEGEVHHDDER